MTGPDRLVTHVRLTIYPDGGVARLRVHGEVVPDPRWLGVSSLLLLKGVLDLVIARGARLINVDATVLAQAPRLASLLPEMAKRLADTLGIAVDAVSVKAKSPEGLGLLGRREGIAAMAVVSVEVG